MAYYYRDAEKFLRLQIEEELVVLNLSASTEPVVTAYLRCCQCIFSSECTLTSIGYYGIVFGVLEVGKNAVPFQIIMIGKIQ